VLARLFALAGGQDGIALGTAREVILIDVATGSRETLIFPGNRNNIRQVVVSPNGRQVAIKSVETFTRVNGVERSPGDQIWVLDRDGSNQIELLSETLGGTNGFGFGGSMVFLDDGETFVFDAGEDASPPLVSFSLDLGSGVQTRLERNVGDISPNGRFVLSSPDYWDRDPDENGVFDTSWELLDLSGIQTASGFFSSGAPQIDNRGNVFSILTFGDSNRQNACTEPSTSPEGFGVSQIDLVNSVHVGWLPLRLGALSQRSDFFRNPPIRCGNVSVELSEGAPFVVADLSLETGERLPDFRPQVHITDAVFQGQALPEPLPDPDGASQVFNGASTAEEFPLCAVQVERGTGHCFATDDARQQYISDDLIGNPQFGTVWIGRFDEEVVAP